MANLQTTDALRWGDRLRTPPVVVMNERLRGGAVRRWRDTDAEMSHPALTHHYVALHLGGPKRVRRRGDGPEIDCEVEAGSLTFVPAETAFTWRTEGPIDFAHLYIHPDRLRRSVIETFDRDPRRFCLVPQVGVRDAVIGTLFAELLRIAEQPDAMPRAYTDTIFETAVASVVAKWGNLDRVRLPAPHALAPTKLRAVENYIQESLAADVGLGELASVAGLSRFHFTRAFKQAKGLPPYAYLTERRIERGRKLLAETTMAVGDIGRACGYGSASRFTSAFRRLTGITPSQYRADRQG
jgi:AraC family transcriptional regulator